jgi:hypothetical protein
MAFSIGKDKPGINKCKLFLPTFRKKKESNQKNIPRTGAKGQLEKERLSFLI